MFVTLDDDLAPLAEHLSGLEAKLAPYGIERMTRFSESFSSQPANWKIVADNYLEGYHVPIAHPGLMRLLDYQRYDVEVGEGWVFFEAPLRDKPSGNRLERALPADGAADARAHRSRRARLALHLHLPEHNNRPVSRPGQHVADQSRSAWTGPTTSMRATARRARARAMRAIQRLNHRLNNEVAAEDADLVARVQAGMATRGWHPGPLGEREAAVAWFADRVRRDLEAFGE